MNPRAHNIDDLLAHAAWLEPLATALVRDPATADDAVQETWIAASQARESGRPVTGGWLKTVLRRRASKEKRSAGRRERRERRRARPEGETPKDELADRELRSRVARAVLSLDDPYRETLLLRYYAELSPGEIAERTATPIHTINTRLRRAREVLREKLDGEFGDRGSWIAALAPFARVDAPGPLPAEPVATQGAANGLVAAAALLAFVGVGLVTVSTFADPAATERMFARSEESSSRLADIPPGRSSVEEQRSETPGSGDSKGSGETSPDTDSPKTVSIVDGERLRGIVEDPATNEPVAGVSIRLHAARWMTAEELFEEAPGLALRPSRDGHFEHEGWAVRWRLEGDSEDVGEFPLLDETRLEPTVLVETTSDADGRFELVVPPSRGVIAATKEGYLESRMMVARRDLSKDFRLRLSRPIDVDVELAFEDGLPRSEPIECLFDPSGPAPRYVTLSPGERRTISMGHSEERVVPLSPRFRVARVEAKTMSGAWQEWTGIAGLAMGLGFQGFRIVVAEAPTLVVVDASGRPIERFSTHAYDESGKRTLGVYRWHAPGGRIGLSRRHRATRVRGERTRSVDARLTVGAAGYRPSTIEIPMLDRSGRITFGWTGEKRVVLERGSSPTLNGSVIVSHGPAAGAPVFVYGSKFVWTYTEGDNPQERKYPRPFAQEIVDGDGRFSIDVPPGRYWVEIPTADGVVRFCADVGADESSTIDVRDLGSIEVRVTDTGGHPIADHMVALSNDFRLPGARSARTHTDSRGVATFRMLPRGEYSVGIPNERSPKTSWSPVRSTNVQLEKGGHAEAALEWTPKRDVEVRIEGPRTRSFANWTARGVWCSRRTRPDTVEWSPVSPDGVVPVDLSTETPSIDIRDPSGNEWWIVVPRGPDVELPDPFVLPLPVDELRVRGRVTDGDRRVAGRRIFASGRHGDLRVRTSTRVGPGGEFELSMPAVGPWEVWVISEREAAGGPAEDAVLLLEKAPTSPWTIDLVSLRE